MAVEPTVPMAMFLYGRTVVRFATAGCEDLPFPNPPWYHWKTEPKLADMLTTLRRNARDNNPTELLMFLATLAG